MGKKAIHCLEERSKIWKTKSSTQNPPKSQFFDATMLTFAKRWSHQVWLRASRAEHTVLTYDLIFAMSRRTRKWGSHNFKHHQWCPYPSVFFMQPRMLVTARNKDLRAFFNFSPWWFFSVMMLAEQHIVFAHFARAHAMILTCYSARRMWGCDFK